MKTSPFREEALEYFARQRGPGELLDVTPAWVHWLYLAFLVLVLVGGIVVSAVLRG